MATRCFRTLLYGLIFLWCSCLPVVAKEYTLQEIPNELYEVAELEGATFSQWIRHIILPMLVPALFMLLTITVINSFKSYTTIVALTGGGPGTSTRTLSYQIYEDAFTYMKFSIASAEGVLMTLVIIIVNAILGRVRKVWEEK